jgi:NAD-specific glutamate dehydrogenase
VDVAKTAEAYFRLAANLNFAILEDALNSIGGEDRWERRAAYELAIELRTARLALTCAVLDNQAEHPAQDVETSIDELKHTRESRFAEVTRLFDELKTAQPPTLPAIHVTIRALSRLAAA